MESVNRKMWALLAPSVRCEIPYFKLVPMYSNGFISISSVHYVNRFDLKIPSCIMRPPSANFTSATFAALPGLIGVENPMFSVNFRLWSCKLSAVRSYGLQLSRCPQHKFQNFLLFHAKIYGRLLISRMPMVPTRAIAPLPGWKNIDDEPFETISTFSCKISSSVSKRRDNVIRE